MKIGIVIPSTPSYSETFFNSKIKGLLLQGYNVQIFVNTIGANFSLCKVNKKPKVYKNKILSVVSFFLVILSLLPSLKSVFRFYKLEKNEGASGFEVLKKIYLNAHILKSRLDWLHFGFATQAIGSELVAKALKAKMAVSFRGFDINIYPKKHPDCYIKLWCNVDKVHSISHYLLDEAYKIGLKTSVPNQIIVPAVDLELINSVLSSNEQEVNKYLSICTIARLNWIKNIALAIETIALLAKTYPNLKYEIIGSGTQKEKEQYLYLVEQLGLSNHVFFHNKMSHIETLNKINNCDIYLQTSLNEGFCNAVLEAQALGKLAVASDVGGLKENIINNKTGWLVAPQNAASFASKIKEIYELPMSSKKGVSEAAINRVKEMFTMDIQKQKFIEFYKF
jgi:colanic acid/amylovoran biosynthesis glycosyltransferase